MSTSSPRPASRQRVLAALELRRYAEAHAEATRLVQQSPDSAEPLGLLARSLIGLGRYGQAQRAAEAGLAIEPRSEWLHRLRALALMDQGGRQLREALAAADESVRMGPDAALAHYTRALVLRRLKRRQEAEVALGRALKLDPSDPKFHFQLGDLRLDAGSPIEAETHYRRGLKLAPESPMALNNLGVALLRQNRPTEAAEAFKAAVRLDPTMGLAKRNTHLTVRRLLGLGPEGEVKPFSVLWRLAFLLVNPPIFLIVGAVAVLGYFILQAFRNRRAAQRRQEILRTDPELYRLFERLDDDQRAGRL